MGENPLSVIDMADETPALNMIPANPLDLPVEAFASALARRLENRRAVIAAIASHLRNGVDYGSIPLKRGPAKPTLFKSGGEKICSMLGLTARFPAYGEYEKSALDGSAIEQIVLRCELLDSNGRVVAEGIGARNTAQDFKDLNKSLKMASKSSSLSAVLNLGFSEIFTVDLDNPPDAPPGQPSGANRSDRPNPVIVANPGPKPAAITPDQASRLESAVEAAGLDPGRVAAYCGKVASAKGLGAVAALRDLPAELFDFILGKLPDLAKHSKAQAEAA